MADRGPRPLTRGWGHFFAAILSVIASTVLITFAWMTLPWWQGLAVTVYGVGVVGLFTVSALYHRWPWVSMRAVQWWRRADHATISVFIAATYTPLCAIVLEPTQALWMLTSAWVGAIMGVILNLVWINPRAGWTWWSTSCWAGSSCRYCRTCGSPRVRPSCGFSLPVAWSIQWGR